HRNKDLNGCGLRALTTHREKETIQFGREIACSSAFYGSDACKFCVVICIPLLKDRDCPIASTRIDSFSIFVVEHVVAITYCRKLLNDVPGARIKHEQPCRHSRHNEQSLVALVECHRIVGECHSCFPGRCHRVLLAINDGNFSRLWKIDIDSSAVFLNLK